MESTNKRTYLHFSIIICLLLLFIIIGLCCGTQFINPFNMTSEIEQQILFDIRLPRVVISILSGMTLAVSGLLIQLTLKNNLADSSILGFQSGSSLAAMILILVFPSYIFLIPIFTFIGGMITFNIIFIINLKYTDKNYLILSGIAINALISAFISMLSIFFSDRLQAILGFTNGSLNSTTSSEMYMMLLFSMISLSIVFVISKKLILLELDDVTIETLGINVYRFRYFICLLSVLLSSISVAYVGIIGFVGLVSPHISRKIIGNNLKLLLPYTMIFGGFIVLMSDVLQRVLLKYYEIPVGIIMSLFGGCFFIYLLMKENHVKG